MKSTIKVSTPDAQKVIGDAVKIAKAEWSADCFLHVLKKVEANLTGKVLHAKRSGYLFKTVRLNSRILDTEDGFVVGTNAIHGIAWELGFHRKAYSFGPAPGRPYSEGDALPATDPRARLRFQLGGAETFARRVKIPAQTFAARPWMGPAVTSSHKYMRDAMAKYLNRNIKKALRKFVGKIEISYGESR